MLAPVIARSPCLTSPSTAAPPRWPGARVGEPTPCWAGCTPTMPRALSAHVPPHGRPPSLFCPHRRAELGKVIRAAQRTAATPPIVGADPGWGRSSPALDVARLCPLGSRAFRAEVLSRDDPNSPARPQAVLEESQEAARPGRPGAAGIPCGADPEAHRCDAIA